MVVYNLGLALLFATLNQVLTVNFTTTHSLAKLPVGSSLVKSLLVAMFSMAGIPPFLGFFAKLSVFVVVSNLYMFVLFPFFFLLLFSGLYFYIQNVRLILASPRDSVAGGLYPRGLGVRRVVHLEVLSYFLSAVLVMGFVFLEDIFVYAAWLLS